MAEYSSGPQNQRPNNTINIDQNEASKLLNDGIKRRVIIALFIIIAIVIASQTIVVTYPNEYKVIMQFSEIRRVVDEPGVSLKIPFIQSADSVPNNMQLYDIPISDVITQDKKTMVADSFVLWRVEDPILFKRTLTGSMSYAESRISNLSYNSMKTVISRLPQSDIISGRDTLANKIFDNVGDQLDPYGVTLIGIETKHLDLPDDNKAAVYARMISERYNIAAGYEAEGEREAKLIRNQTDMQVSITISQAKALAAETVADGERQYMEILSDAYNNADKAEYYAFVRALDAAKAAYEGGETTLILSKDSPLAQMFYSLDSVGSLPTVSQTPPQVEE